MSVQDLIDVLENVEDKSLTVFDISYMPVEGIELTNIQISESQDMWADVIMIK